MTNESLSFIHDLLPRRSSPSPSPSPSPPTADKFGLERHVHAVTGQVTFTFQGRPCYLFKRRVPVDLLPSHPDVARCYGGYLVVPADPTAGALYTVNDQGGDLQPYMAGQAAETAVRQALFESASTEAFVDRFAAIHHVDALWVTHLSPHS